jgi:hypothetical protein
MRLPCGCAWVRSPATDDWLSCQRYFLLVGFLVVDEAWLLMLEG